MALKVISTMVVDGKKIILDELPKEQKDQLMEELEELVAEKMGLVQSSIKPIKLAQ